MTTPANPPDELTEADLKIIGDSIGGTFHHAEKDVLVYGSHTFPSYRITVDKQQAIECLERRFQEIRENAQAD